MENFFVIEPILIKMELVHLEVMLCPKHLGACDNMSMNSIFGDVIHPASIIRKMASFEVWTKKKHNFYLTESFRRF